MGKLRSVRPRVQPCGLFIAAVVALGCATNPRAPLGEPGAVLEAGRRRGVSLHDPLALEQSTLDTVKNALGTRGDPLDRLRHLDEYLKGSKGFRYSAGQHLDAQEAYDERRGDCLSYAMLFGALGRHLGVPTHFLHASEVGLRFERAGSFFASSHVAVGYGTGPRKVVIDFSQGRVSDWHMSAYEPIADSTVVALHYNNLAVARMTSGRMEEAERLFRALLDVETRVPELYNNFGVLLNRRGRSTEAVEVLGRGLSSFPAYPPLYTNAIHAAHAADRPELAAEFEQRGRTVAERDPSFLFARGMFLYRKRSYGYAAEQFARARGAHPDSPVILAWLTRAYAAAGDRQRAREAFSEARRISPQGPVVLELSSQFPDLAQ